MSHTLGQKGTLPGGSTSSMQERRAWRGCVARSLDQKFTALLCSELPRCAGEQPCFHYVLGCYLAPWHLMPWFSTREQLLSWELSGGRV